MAARRRGSADHDLWHGGPHRHNRETDDPIGEAYGSSEAACAVHQCRRSGHQKGEAYDYEYDHQRHAVSSHIDGRRSSCASHRVLARFLLRPIIVHL